MEENKLKKRNFLWMREKHKDTELPLSLMERVDRERTLKKARLAQQVLQETVVPPDRWINYDPDCLIHTRGIVLRPRKRVEIREPKASEAFEGWALDRYGELFITTNEDMPLAFARRTLNGGLDFDDDRAKWIYKKFMDADVISRETIERAWEASRYSELNLRVENRSWYDPNWAKLCFTGNYIEPITEDTPTNDIRRQNVSEETLSIIAMRRIADWQSYSWDPPTGYRGKADDDFYNDHTIPMKDVELQQIIENALKAKMSKCTGESNRESGRIFS